MCEQRTNPKFKDDWNKASKSKSIQNSDRFTLENTCAGINKVLSHVEGKDNG